MKRCPTCNRIFADPGLSFCLEDGTPLVKADTPSPDPEATIVGASSTTRQGNAGAPEPVEGSAPSAPAYQPPGQFASPPVAGKRRVWPWVVGVLVLLLIGVAGIGIAAVFVIPNMMREAGNNENNSNVNANSGPNLNANQSANGNSNANTNSLVANENKNANADSNTNANEEVAGEPPTDADEVLADLTALEREWTEANFSADKKKLARILADDFVGTTDGNIHGKADYLRDIKPEKVQDWDFTDLKLTLKGDRATLKGKLRQEREGADEEVLQFTDKFVWRDERWQAVASEVSRIK